MGQPSHPVIKTITAIKLYLFRMTNAKLTIRKALAVLFLNRQLKAPVNQNESVLSVY